MKPLYFERIGRYLPPLKSMQNALTAVQVLVGL